MDLMMRRRVMIARKQGGDDLIISTQALTFELFPNTYISKDDGSLVQYNGWTSTGFIPIGNGICIYNPLSRTTSDLDYAFLYNAEKNGIRNIVWFPGDLNPFFLIMPDNSFKYVRLSQKSSNMSTLQIFPIISGKIKIKGDTI